MLHGDTLAPYLFMIVLDYVLREAIEDPEESLGLPIKPRQGLYFSLTLSKAINGPKYITPLWRKAYASYSEG